MHVGTERFHVAWDPAIPPVAEVPSGTIIEYEMRDASCGQLTPQSSAADVAALDRSCLNPVTGPVAVAGARPGDTLQVDVLELTPGSWGWTACVPGFGLLADVFREPHLQIVSIAPGEPI